jgi:hypothetical protein
MIIYSGRTSSLHLQEKSEENGKKLQISRKNDNESQGATSLTSMTEKFGALQ